MGLLYVLLFAKPSYPQSHVNAVSTPGALQGWGERVSQRPSVNTPVRPSCLRSLVFPSSVLLPAPAVYCVLREHMADVALLARLEMGRAHPLTESPAPANMLLDTGTHANALQVD